MDENREYLNLWLARETKRRLRFFEEAIAQLNTELAAKGLFKSGFRIKQSIRLMRETAESFADAGFAEMRVKKPSEAGHKMVADSLQRLLEGFQARLPKVVFHPHGNSQPQNSDEMRAAEKLFASLQSDLDDTVDLAKLEIGASKKKIAPPATRVVSARHKRGTIPNGYIGLETAYFEFTEELKKGSVAKVVEPDRNDEDPELVHWRAAILSDRHAEQAMRCAMTQYPGYPALAVWTRIAGMAEVERIDSKLFAAPNSVIWDRTLKAGALLRISIEKNDSFARAPLFLRSDDWTRCSPALIALAEKARSLQEEREPGPALPVDQPPLPLWLNSFQASAWLKYRDDEAARTMDHWYARAAETFYGERPLIGNEAELVLALQSGKIIAYGSIDGRPYDAIQAVDWSTRRLTALDSHFMHPYSDIRFATESLKKLFPPIGATGEKAKTRLPRLGDAALTAWWNALDAETKKLPQAELYIIANTAFPDKHIGRDRIRALTPGRKQGPRPIGGKATAE